MKRNQNCPEIKPYNLLAPEIDSTEFAESIINAHGQEEWHMGLLTYQLHGHWGIYSLLGAKMGLYARELSLFSGKVERVISSAGQLPPLSCFNDGLQVSTGATLGNGRILLGQGPFSVSAHFNFNHHSFTLALQPSLNRQLLRKIDKIKSTCSGSTYWRAIEHLSMIFWLRWNRKSIFDIEKIES